MPIYDYKCKSCGFSKTDVLVRVEEKVMCTECGKEMERQMGTFSFNFTPSGMSKFKKKYGKRVPDEYKTTGGANFYAKPKKTK